MDDATVENFVLVTAMYEPLSHDIELEIPGNVQKWSEDAPPSTGYVLSIKQARALQFLLGEAIKRWELMDPTLGRAAIANKPE